MSMKRKAMQITLPGVVNDFLHELMEEIGLNKSDLLESMVFFVSMPEHLEDFKSQFVFEEEDDDEDEEEDDDDDEDEEEDDEEDDEEEE